jgi:stage III sporulation protein AC
MQLDMSLIFKLGALGIMVTVIVQLLKQTGREEMSILVTIAGLVIGLAVIIKIVSDLFSQVNSTFGIF